MPINTDRLEKRKQVDSRRPKFKRPESWRYKRLQTNWRKPKGVDNHIRKQLSRGRPGIVKVGYRGPKVSRGLHPSGYTDNLVFNSDNLKDLDPKVDGIRIGHSVGTKKRIDIIKAAMEEKFKIFNGRVDLFGSKS